MMQCHSRILAAAAKCLTTAATLNVLALLLVVLLSSANSAAQTDPFVGTWAFNADKSPKPTIKYAIKDLGANRYALTGSTGETTEIKADGISIKSPSGATVSFKKLDDHNWEMNRVDTRNIGMVRTYTISADDKTLTLVDVFTGDDGSKDKSTTTYARLTPGHSIFGEWQSVSMVDESSGKPGLIIIEPYGKHGLSFTDRSGKHRTRMNFDGKIYFADGPGDPKGESSSGRRVSARLLELDSQVNGKPEDKDEYKISEDGKTLTIVSRPVNSSAVFTSVWDRQTH